MLKHLTRRIRRHWPRGSPSYDSHYGRTEAIVVRGQRLITSSAGRQCGAARPCARPARRSGRATPKLGGDKVRGRRLRLRRRLVEPRTPRGRPAGGDDPRLDARYIVTSLEGGPRHLYEGIYCGRGQENLIKAQIPARLRPHLLPEPARVQAGPAHRRLLADARARMPCRAACAPLGRVRNPPPETAQDRRALVEKADVSASTSTRPAPTPPCSAAGGPVRRLGTLTAGAVPRQSETLQPSTSTSKTSDPGTVAAPNAHPCALQTNRFNRPDVNTSGYRSRSVRRAYSIGQGLEYGGRARVMSSRLAGRRDAPRTRGCQVRDRATAHSPAASRQRTQC